MNDSHINVCTLFLLLIHLVDIVDLNIFVRIVSGSYCNETKISLHVARVGHAS